MHQVEHDELKKMIEDVIDKKLEPFKPILQIYNQAQGFTNFTVVIMKSLLLFGATIGIIYGFFKWIKN